MAKFESRAVLLESEIFHGQCLRFYTFQQESRTFELTHGIGFRVLTKTKYCSPEGGILPPAKCSKSQPRFDLTWRLPVDQVRCPGVQTTRRRCFPKVADDDPRENMLKRWDSSLQTRFAATASLVPRSQKVLYRAVDFLGSSLTAPARVLHDGVSPSNAAF